MVGFYHKIIKMMGCATIEKNLLTHWEVSFAKVCPLNCCMTLHDVNRSDRSDVGFLLNGFATNTVHLRDDEIIQLKAFGRPPLSRLSFISLVL